MKKLMLFLAVLPFAFFSCDDDESDPVTFYQNIDIVTGIDLLDDNGQALGRWKSPNDHHVQINAFPNPCLDVISIHSPETIVQIWLTPATCEQDETENISTLATSLNYTISDIQSIQIKDIPISGFNNQVTLQLSDVTPGFYKLFYQLDGGAIRWQNIYADPTALSLPDIAVLDRKCN